MLVPVEFRSPPATDGCSGQAVVESVGDRLGAVANAGLGEQVVDVALDRRLADSRHDRGRAKGGGGPAEEGLRAVGQLAITSAAIGIPVVWPLSST